MHKYKVGDRFTYTNVEVIKGNVRRETFTLTIVQLLDNGRYGYSTTSDGAQTADTSHCSEYWLDRLDKVEGEPKQKGVGEKMHKYEEGDQFAYISRFGVLEPVTQGIYVVTVKSVTAKGTYKCCVSRKGDIVTEGLVCDETWLGSLCDVETLGDIGNIADFGGKTFITAIADSFKSALWQDEGEAPAPEPTNALERASALLGESKDLIAGQRNKDYGTPEENFGNIAAFWNVYLEARGLATGELTSQDAAHMMELLKLARLCRSPDHHDSHLDKVGYGALAKGLSEHV